MLSSRTFLFLAVLATLILTGCDNLLLPPPKALQPPAAPGDVAVSAGNAEAIVLFTSVPNAKSYNLYYSASSTVSPKSGTKVTGVSSPAKVTGLNNGSVYSFVVTAVNAGGESAPSPVATVTPQVPPPGVPTGFAGSPGDGSVSLKFEPVPGSTSYNVYYAAADTVTIATGILNAGAEGNRTITGLTNGVLYSFIITAVNAGGESAPSSMISVTPQVSPPGAPAGVSATSGDRQVTIDFDTASDSTSYNLYYAASDTVTPGTGVKILGIVRPKTVTGLNNGVRYTFIITAVNAGGESAPSSPVSATPQVPLPGTPSGVSSTGGDGSVTVEFQPVTNSASYNLYYAAGNSVTTATGQKLAGVTSPKTVTGLTNGTKYTFLVTAVNAGGESAPSASSSATPQVPLPLPPTGLQSAGGNGSVTIEFDQAQDATSHNLYYAAGNTVTTGTGTKLTGITNPRTITGLTNGTKYTFLVTAVNAGGESGPSLPSSATPQIPIASPPTGVSASAGDASATVSFNSMDGASSYNLYYAASNTVTLGSGTKLTGVTSPKAVMGLSNGVTYTFIVTSVNAAGESAASAPATATPQVPQPAAPAILTVAAGTGEVTISFSSVSGATGYNLYYTPGNTVSTSTGTKLTGVTSPQTVTGLVNGTTYTFIVTATNTAGESSASAPSAGTPQAAASPTLPTRLLYTGGNLSKAYETNFAIGGNDTLVPGFDSAVYHVVFRGSDLYYLTFDGSYVVKCLNPSGTDAVVPGFDTLSYSTVLTTDGTDLYYTNNSDLYQMVDGTANDVLITGFDKARGSSNLFYKWNGSDWYYYSQSGDYSTWGVYQRVGTEANLTGANDVKLTGFEVTQVGPISNDNSTDFYYRGWGPTSPVYQYQVSGPDTILEGFDRKATQFFYHSGKFYSLVSTKLYEMVLGTGDDSTLSTVDTNTGVVFIGWNGTTTFTVYQDNGLGKRVLQNNSGTDTEVSGFDDSSNIDFAVFDGSDYYYLVWNSVKMNRVIYKKVGTETNRSGTNDIPVLGMDKNLGYGAYDFQKSGADFYYQNSGKVYRIVGDEETFTGTNDVQITGFDLSVVHFALIEGEFYYSDSNQDIYKMAATGTDQLLFSGSKIDGDMTSMLLLP